MSHLSAKKQEELNSKKVRDLLRIPENKKCFDCSTKSPFFVNVSIQTFVCTRCSGLVREVGHRVKSISASKFSGPEVVALQQGGNEIARQIWLSSYKMGTSDPETDSDVRLFMRQKYYEQKWLDREKLKQHAECVKKLIKEMFTEDGTRRSRVSTPPLPSEAQPLANPDQNNNYFPNDTRLHSVDAPHTLNRPIQKAPVKDLLIDDVAYEQPKVNSAIGFAGSTLSSLPYPQSPPAVPLSPASKPTSPVTQAKSTQSLDISSPTKSTNNFLSELAGLETSPTVNRPTYTGGMLVPNSTGTTSPISPSFPMSTQATRITDLSNAQSNLKDSDPYAALRNLSLNSPPATNSLSRSGQTERARSMSMQYSSPSPNNTWGGFVNAQGNQRPIQGTSGTAGPYTHLRQNSTPNPNLFGDLDPLAQFKGKHEGHRG
ncbi:ArfGAP with FG repeats 1 [Apophysomyces ossiformis]|uniref:ArfGAP with FG repeats 1 n=1 Tax=Apophysomyces ossiformis TaxID=679940 RepID=A0A8H7EUW2_9FUNG|nr:ArfGAP with FG repeats 1 [Apophysomyces ossiformis]